MDVLTRSSSAPNPVAGLSLAAGIASLAAWPVALALARYSKRVDLVYASVGAVGVGAALGIVAILLARRAVTRIQRTLGRSGGAGRASAGRAVGILGVCVAITGALALGFFGLLELFAR